MNLSDVLSGTSSIGVHHTGGLEGWFGEHWWTGRTFVLLVTTLAVFAPLACFKRIVHTTANELKDSSLLQPAVRTSLVLCSTVYITTGFFGLLLFGESTLDDVLANFDTNLGIPYRWLLNDAVRVIYALHLMLVFPVIFYPLRLNLHSLLFPSARPFVSDNPRFTLINTGLISLIYLDANLTQNLGCFPVHWIHCFSLPCLHLTCCHCSKRSLWYSYKEGQDTICFHDCSCCVLKFCGHI